MKIINIIRRIIDPHHYSSDAYVKYLRSKGVDVGENTYFFSPRSVTVDIQNAQFVKIGSKCKITRDVAILAHDYSYSVLRSIYHDIPKKAATTEIGNNVFIGIKSIILMGSKIGDNSIIGAGSVVCGHVPSNEVWAGNPARFVCTIDEYHEKCMKKFEESAILFVKKYREKNNNNPSIQELQYYSLLFLNNDKNYNAKEEYSRMSFNGDDKDEVITDLLRYKSKYNSYEEFLSVVDSSYKKKNN